MYEPHISTLPIISDMVDTATPRYKTASGKPQDVPQTMIKVVVDSNVRNDFIANEIISKNPNI